MMIIRFALAFLLLPWPAVREDFERGPEVLKRKGYDKAVASNAPLQEDPDDPYTLTNRGLAHHEKKEYDQALKDFTEALRLDLDYCGRTRDESL